MAPGVDLIHGRQRVGSKIGRMHFGRVELVESASVLVRDVEGALLVEDAVGCRQRFRVVRIGQVGQNHLERSVHLAEAEIVEMQRRSQLQRRVGSGAGAQEDHGQDGGDAVRREDQVDGLTVAVGWTFGGQRRVQGQRELEVSPREALLQSGRRSDRIGGGWLDQQRHEQQPPTPAAAIVQRSRRPPTDRPVAVAEMLSTRLVTPLLHHRQLRNKKFANQFQKFKSGRQSFNGQKCADRSLGVSRFIRRHG